MLHLALLIQACAVIHSHATAKQSRVAQEAGKRKEYYPPSALYCLEMKKLEHYTIKVEFVGLMSSLIGASCRRMPLLHGEYLAQTTNTSLRTLKAA